MIANNLTILANHEISTIGIISSCPFFGRCHSECSIKEKDFHFMGVESLFILSFEIERVSFSNFGNTLIDRRFTFLILYRKELVNIRFIFILIAFPRLR